MGRIVEERVADTALIDQNDTKASLLSLDSAGQASWPGTHHEQVEYLGLGAFQGEIVHENRLGHSGDLGVRAGLRVRFGWEMIEW